MLIDTFTIVCIVIFVFAVGLFIGYLAGFGRGRESS